MEVHILGLYGTATLVKWLKLAFYDERRCTLRTPLLRSKSGTPKP